MINMGFQVVKELDYSGPRKSSVNRWTFEGLPKVYKKHAVTEEKQVPE